MTHHKLEDTSSLVSSHVNTSWHTQWKRHNWQIDMCHHIYIYIEKDIWMWVHMSPHSTRNLFCRYTYSWVMSHVWMRHGTYIGRDMWICDILLVTPTHVTALSTASHMFMSHVSHVNTTGIIYWKRHFDACNSYTCPPDPISHVCSLPGKYISRKYFTYRPVQIFKIMFRRFVFSRIWSSAQDHALLVLLLNLVGFFISTRPRWSGENNLYHSCTSFEGASRVGQPFNIFTWFIGAGGTALSTGSVDIHVYESCRTCEWVMAYIMEETYWHV